MILVWNNTNVFRQHIEEMESFRRTHAHLAPAEPLKTVRAAPVPINNHCSLPSSHPDVFTDKKGKTIVVPIWDLSMPKGSEN